MSKNDGGPAFPSSWQYSEYDSAETKVLGGGLHGMSLRDWFAGQALAGLLAGPGIEPYGEGKDLSLEEMMSAESYAIADAMLVERDKETPDRS